MPSVTFSRTKWNKIIGTFWPLVGPGEGCEREKERKWRERTGKGLERREDTTMRKEWETPFCYGVLQQFRGHAPEFWLTCTLAPLFIP